MTPTPLRCATKPELVRAVRAAARAQALPVDVRARLVLAVSAVAEDVLAAGEPVSLTWGADARSEDGACLLTLAFGSPRAGAAKGGTELALPAASVTADAVVWRLPVAAGITDGADRRGRVSGTGDAGTGDAEARASDLADFEEELRAVVTRADALSADHRRLKDELSETNSGVLALYVQLDERDEALRNAHGQTLRELEDALRPAPIKVDGVELAVHYEPAGTDAPTGGDLYDWFVLPDGTLHITIVDALGHGVTSTRGALNVTHAVRTLALEGHDLRSIVGRTDEILLSFDRQTMATVLLVRLNPVTGELLLANGSHPPALLLRAEGTAGYLEVRGRGIGFPLPGSDGLLTEQMAPGDLLVLYTDGLTESRRDPLEGESRLIEAARKHALGPIDHIPGAIADDMHTVILHPDDTLALAVRLSGTGFTRG
ncbi:PP2C family protein-serine/threonine phosphatase [Streptomyces sp. NPDC048639]|uniref:PP2C family protein-serine/threonine phosphatase n=1 Tax=Streptomyces sp. NPDC048639 TaxID=3365581 RepID=UPI00372179E9